VKYLFKEGLRVEMAVPDYLKLMIDSKIMKAKQLQDKKTLSFTFFTDPHFVDVSTFADINILNYIYNKMDVEFVACCGDNLDNGETKQIHLATAAKLIDKLTFHNYFTVKGNHDDNSLISNGIDNIKYTMLPEEQYDIMFKRLDKIVNFDDLNPNGLYYYYDISKFKVRVIFLNSIDIPYVPNKSNPSAWKYDGQNTYAYSNAQLNWLAHIALKLPNNQWKVMFFTHINPFAEEMIGADNLAYNSSILLEIIDSFKSGTSYMSLETGGDFGQSVSMDFSSQGPGNVIAFFYGHTHSEQVLTRNGIKYISTWNDAPRKSVSNPNAPARTIGTNSEVCLNIVTVNFSTNKMFMTKLGAGNDLIIEF
jgi:hypothetical protein